jgi:hypothetical protein
MSSKGKSRHGKLMTEAEQRSQQDVQAEREYEARPDRSAMGSCGRAAFADGGGGQSDGRGGRSMETA